MIELYTKVGDAALKRPAPFFRFPAGEHHMRYRENVYIGDEIVYIEGTDVNDYVKALLWYDATNLAKSTTAIIPYLPAARGDKGVPRASAVYAQLIPDTEKIIVVDAHSPYMTDILYQRSLGADIINVTAKDIFENCKKTDNKWEGVIAPDKGAKQRAQEVADYLGVPLYQAEKVRDQETGKLSGFTCEEIPYNSKDSRILVVDDICDGGGTFVGLADYLWNQGYIKEKSLDLWVTHGIFSQGFSSLDIWYNTIYTTDSIFDRNEHSKFWEESKNLKQINIKDYLLQLA